MKSDLRFGWVVLVTSVLAAITLVIVGGLLIDDRRLLGLSCFWLSLGFLSVWTQVTYNFGYIRLVPRFDALFSFTLSIIAGPISLVRVVRGLRTQ